jgi:hypothetical protein
MISIYVHANDDTFVVYYPDKLLTPGDTLAVSKNDLCNSNYEKTVKPVHKARAMYVFNRYNIDYANHNHYKLDHLIPISLGGSNKVTNLWPVKYCNQANARKHLCAGAREKKVVEDALRISVCNNTITIEQAQKIIAIDWYNEYMKIKNIIPVKKR